MKNRLLFLLLCFALYGCAGLGGLGGGGKATWIKKRGGNSERIEFSLESAKTDKGLWVPGAMISGDAIEYGSGSFKVPQIKKSILVSGQGKDKTTLKGNMSFFGFHEVNVAFKDVTLDSPQVRLKTAKIQVTFMNVKVKGPISIAIYDFNKNFPRNYKNTEKMKTRDKQRGAQVAFINADFEQPYKTLLKSYHHNVDVFIGPSRLKKNGKYVPYMMKKVGNLDLSEAYDAWMKVDVSDPTSTNYRLALNSVRRKILKLKEQNTISTLAKKSYARMDQSFEKYGFIGVDLKVSANELQKAQSLFSKGLSFQKNKNHFLAAYTFNRAKELSGGKIPNLKNAIDTNKSELQKKYGCNLKVRQLDKTRSTSSPMRGGIKSYRLNKNIALSEFQDVLNGVSPVFVALGGQNSLCQFEVNILVNHFLGKDSGRKVISRRDVYKQKSDPIAAMARRAAKEAAWDAAMARTNAAINKMTSTARQLHQNRNRIESRSGGTYLVINNRKLRDTGQQDRQKIASLQNQSRQALATANSSGGSQMVKTGDLEITSTYHMSMRDAYQIQLDMKSSSSTSVTYKGPLAQNNRSFGPCTRKLNTGGIGANITGPCMQGNSWRGYASDDKLRKEYVQNALAPVVLEFLTQNVVTDFVKEISKKSKSKSNETKLDGMLLAYLITGKADKSVVAKSKSLIGEQLTLEKFKEYALY